MIGVSETWDENTDKAEGMNLMPGSAEGREYRYDRAGVSEKDQERYERERAGRGSSIEIDEDAADGRYVDYREDLQLYSVDMSVSNHDVAVAVESIERLRSYNRTVKEAIAEEGLARAHKAAELTDTEEDDYYVTHVLAPEIEEKVQDVTERTIDKSEFEL